MYLELTEADGKAAYLPRKAGSCGENPDTVQFTVGVLKKMNCRRNAGAGGFARPGAHMRGKDRRYGTINRLQLNSSRNPNTGVRLILTKQAAVRCTFARCSGMGIIF